MSDFLNKVKDVAVAVIGKKTFVSAVVLAGGSGTRVGGDVTKQMIEVCKKPLVVHTLLAFEACEYINEIVVVAKTDELTQYREFKERYNITKLTNVVEGGETRQLSAKAGFDAINKKADYVAIHDGARALITASQIKAVIMSAFAHGAAIAATRATDTVKYSEGVRVDETVPRDNVWLAQTPQVFKDEIYRAAIYMAINDDYEGTDDSSLVEHIGVRVYLVDTGNENFKVTYKSDVARAEILLSEREEKTE